MTAEGEPHRCSSMVGILLFFLLPFSLHVSAADWPQYRGTNHDGITFDRINKTWIGSATNPIWRVVLTNSLSSLAVSGGRVYTQARRPIGGVSKEICIALDASDGRELWATPVDDAVYPNGGVGLDDGPRTTPSVEGGSVFVLTSYLKLYRLNAANGGTNWQKDLRALYGGNVIAWQNAASPLVENGLIFVNTGSSVSNVMALRTSDGTPAWRAQREGMTHATPVLATIQGVRQLIFATTNGISAFDPATGTRFWQSVYPFRYSTSLGASPVVHQDMVFISGAHSYGMGSFVEQVRLINGTWVVTRLWSTNNPASHWMTPVCHQGFLYGQFGIQQFDSTNGQLKCVDMRTGAVKWSTNNFGRGATLLVDNHLLSITEKGLLVLSQPKTNAYTEVARFTAIPFYNDFTNKCWNAPAVSDGRVYIRSSSYVAAFDFSMPDLIFDPPQPTASDKLRLTVRTVDGSPIASNRLAGLEVRASTNVSLALTQWVKLTNTPILTNGVVRINGINMQTDPERVFKVKEPQ